jgi:2-dehydro-3-deoxyphosphogluconate aldolase / (4S)-4-hydroxy-2-oxoglutarate aldolase
MQNTLQQIQTGRVIAILRGCFDGRETEIAAALFESGITAMEVTLNSPGALAAIERIASAFGDRMAVGAGTVLTPDQVRQVVEKGARFVVSPNRDCSVIRATKALGLVSVPGCFTPSEVVEAIDAGADAVKIFPAACLGPVFVKGLRGPLPEVRTVPTGGVTPEIARQYFDAGAWAVGVGSELVGGDANESGWLDRVRVRARAYAVRIAES